MTGKSTNGNDFIELGCQVADDGSRLAVRHHSDGSIEGVVVQPMVAGQSIPPNTSVLALSHRQDDIYDVTDSYEPGRTGPARVTSPAYRTGWDQVFGKKPAVGQA